MVIVDPAVRMEVLKSTVISEQAAAKLLKKFMENKDDEENVNLMVRTFVLCTAEH